MSTAVHKFSLPNVLVSGAFLVVMLGSAAHAQTSESEIKSLKNRWVSSRVLVTTSGKAKVGNESEHAINARTETRILQDSAKVSLLDEKGRFTESSVFANSESFSISYDGNGKPNHINRDQTLNGPVTPLQFGLKYGDRWLADLVSDGTLKPLGNQERGRYMIYEGDPGHNWKLRVTFDKNASMLATKIEDWSPDGKIHGVKEILQTQKVDGIVAPLDARETRIDETVGSNIQVSDHFSEIKFGDTSPKDFVEPDLDPGSTVKDDRTLEMYEIGPNGEKIRTGTVSGGQKPSWINMGMAWVTVFSVASLLALGAWLPRQLNKRSS